MLGLRFCARAFSSCSERGLLLIAVRGPLTIAASRVAEHRLQTRRLSNCGSRARSLRGMWDPPRPGLEHVSPALAGGFSATAPPGKPYWALLTSRYCVLSKAHRWPWGIHSPAGQRNQDSVDLVQGDGRERLCMKSCRTKQREWPGGQMSPGDWGARGQA